MIEIFSTDTCARCKILKTRLRSKGIEFKENTDEEQIRKLGFTTVPILKTEEGELFDFGKAITYISSL